MIRPHRGFVVGLALLAALGATALGVMRLRPGAVERPFLPPDPGDTETVDVTEYARPKDDDSPLADDRIEDKTPKFDPDRVDPRPIGDHELNASAAVIRLDVPMASPDRDAALLVLHPNYASAIRGAPGEVIPSVNLIDGKAKQFDDGLYAAIDRAYFLGHGPAMKGHYDTIRRIYARVSNPSPAADYLSAGLGLGGEVAPASPRALALRRAFTSLQVDSRPIGVYTWDDDLRRCFRVLRYFSRPIEDDAIAAEIARVLREDRALRDDYTRAITFDAGLTNPLVGRSPADLVDGPPLGPGEHVRLFPPSTSREAELFLRLYPDGLPPGARPMRDLIAAIRSGTVDLAPRAGSGWYDHQVYALETLLLPGRGDEAGRLLLTRSYKKRMMEAFQALMTKRRETHARQLMMPSGAAAPVAEVPPVRPRLRLEPNVTYYLRTARSYDFLAGFLGVTLGEATLRSLKGLREGGERGMDLDAELRRMRDLFFGLACLGAEDIGAPAPSLDGEPLARPDCIKLAADWLAQAGSDPDLAVDTRVAVPIDHDARTGIVKTWATVGVRLTALEATYARPPSVRPRSHSADWKPLEPTMMYPGRYLIAVDEFAEVEVPGGRVYDRAELRALCDRLKTRAKIVEALGR